MKCVGYAIKVLSHQMRVRGAFTPDLLLWIALWYSI